MLKRPEGTSLETESSKRGHDIQKRGDFYRWFFTFLWNMNTFWRFSIWKSHLRIKAEYKGSIAEPHIRYVSTSPLTRIVYSRMHTRSREVQNNADTVQKIVEKCRIMQKHAEHTNADECRTHAETCRHIDNSVRHTQTHIHTQLRMTTKTRMNMRMHIHTKMNKTIIRTWRKSVENEEQH